MSIPDYQFLMLPVLKAAAHGEVRISAVVDELANQLQLTGEERAELLPSGKQTVFSNRAHWAKSYLSKAQLVELTRRGFFTITPLGQSVLEQNPTAIDNHFLNQFEGFRQFRARSNNDEAEDATASLPPVADLKETPDEVMRAAHRQIDSALGQDLLDRVRSAPPDFFERLIVGLLLSMGYGGSGVGKAGRTLGAPVMMASMALLIRTRSVSIACISKPSVIRPGTTSVLARSEIFLAASTVIRPARGCL